MLTRLLRVVVLLLSLFRFSLRAKPAMSHLPLWRMKLARA